MQNIFKIPQKIMAILLVILLVVTSNIISFPAPAWAEVGTIIEESNNDCSLSKSCGREITTISTEYLTTNSTVKNNIITIEQQNKEKDSNLTGVGEVVIDGLLITAGIIIGIIVAPVVVPLIWATNNEESKDSRDGNITNNSDSHDTTTYNCYAFSSCSS